MSGRTECPAVLVGSRTGRCCARMNSEAARCGKHQAASDPPTRTTEGQAAMNVTRIRHVADCVPWTGPEHLYQREAGHVVYVETGQHPSQLSWITPKCPTPACLDFEHLAISAPRVISYPSGVCVYCGTRAWSRDHLLPRTWTGDTARSYVAVVPACGECNSAIGDRVGPCITDRRDYARGHIRRKYASILRTVDRSPSELWEFGPTLRSTILDGMAAKRRTIARLSWPTDPAYDLRAFQVSGIDDPYLLGLIKAAAA